MKINSIVFMTLILCTSICKSYAQSSLTIEASQNITNFRFKNSAGVKIKDYTPNYSGSYALGYQYSLENGIYFSGKLGLKSAGATYIYDQINYHWNLNYLETRLGVGYSYALGKFGIQGSILGYYGYLLKANQLLNNQNLNAITTEGFRRGDLGIFISPGVSFEANEYISIYLNLNYMLGLRNLETIETQQSYNTLFGGTLGLIFPIQ